MNNDNAQRKFQFRDSFIKFLHKQALHVFVLSKEARFLRFWVIFCTSYLRNEFGDSPIFLLIFECMSNR